MEKGITKLMYVALAIILANLAHCMIENQIFLQQQELWVGNLPANLSELFLGIFCALASIVCFGIALFERWVE